MIEVALPLEAINTAAAREKSIHQGHPSTLHLYWARRPLAAVRAVIFASLIDDPSAHPEIFKTEEAQQAERKRLEDFISKLVQWENINNQDILKQAKAEIAKYYSEDKLCSARLPELFDPFAGGGSIPLEGQRLGLKVHAHDLNPIAVMINKAMIEIPPKYCNKPPVNPESQRSITAGSGTFGLAEDVKYYAAQLKDKAYAKLAALYPPVTLSANNNRTVIAWLWARTVKCPNPACGCELPLMTSFVLSSKENHEAYIELEFDEAANRFDFHVRSCSHGEPVPASAKNGTKASVKATFVCPKCGAAAGPQYLKDEATAGRMGARLTAVVAEGSNGRLYLDPDDEQLKASMCDRPADYPEQEMNQESMNLVSGRGYGFTHWHQLFTPRQLTMLVTLCDLIPAVRDEIKSDGIASGLDEQAAMQYANDVSVYLEFIIDKLADFHSSICGWVNSGEKMRNTFARQAIPMVWNFAEANPFSNSTGCFSHNAKSVIECINILPSKGEGIAMQFPAQEFDESLKNLMISTDPPYYDNIGYADLSDYFYTWLRRNLHDVYPDVLSYMATPKSDELIAAPYRHGGDMQAAKNFFEQGMSQVCKNLYSYARDDIPVTIYYAYKQQDSREDDGTASSGWETMLNAIINAGFMITGTWPMRTELVTGLKKNVSALSSSIILVCRKRDKNVGSISRGEFMAELDREFKPAVAKLQQGSISPVDMAQSAIGPGMAVYSKYEHVINNADGTSLTVRAALKIINDKLDKLLDPEADNVDKETLFCIELYKLKGYAALKAGDADVLARAKNVSLKPLDDKGILEEQGGEVKLIRREDFNCDIKAIARDNLWLQKAPALIKGREGNIWFLTQLLVHALKEGGGLASGWILWAIINSADGSAKADKIKSLAYRLYNIADRMGDSQETLAYNSLVSYWPSIEKAAKEHKDTSGQQVMIGDL